MPAALELGHIYQANPSCPCYNLYIHPVFNYDLPTHWGRSTVYLLTRQNALVLKMGVRYGSQSVSKRLAHNAAVTLLL